MINRHRNPSTLRQDASGRLLSFTRQIAQRPAVREVLAAIRAFWKAPGQFRLPLFLIALGCGVASAYTLVVPYAHNPAASAEPSNLEVLVAKRNLQPGEVVSRETVAVRSLPRAYAEEAMLSPERIDDVDGSVLKEFLAAGEPLLRSRMELPTERIRHPSLGMRLVQVVVEDRFGLQHLPAPGDHVDLFWQDQIAAQRGFGPGAAGLFLLEDVAVKSIRRLKAEPGSALARRNGGAGVVQLEVEVTPEHAMQLVRASAHGVLQMTLRHPADRGLLPLADKPAYPVERQTQTAQRADRPKAGSGVSIPATTPVSSPVSAPVPGSLPGARQHAASTAGVSSSQAGGPAQQRFDLSKDNAGREGSQRADASGVEVIRGGQRTIQESGFPPLPAQGSLNHHFRSRPDNSATPDNRGSAASTPGGPTDADPTVRALRDPLDVGSELERREPGEILRGAASPASVTPRTVR